MKKLCCDRADSSGDSPHEPGPPRISETSTRGATNLRISSTAVDRGSPEFPCGHDRLRVVGLANPRRYNLFGDTWTKMGGESSDCQPWKARRGVIVSFSWKPEIAGRE